MNNGNRETTQTPSPAPTLGPRGRSDVRVHELDGEALIFDPVSADTHRLNETALFIWRQCDGRQNAARIARRLTDMYDVSDDEARTCVDRVLADLETCGLITAADESQA